MNEFDFLTTAWNVEISVRSIHSRLVIYFLHAMTEISTSF